MEIESKQHILERRKEIEKELADMLKETESEFSLQDVRDAIYHKEETDDMVKVVAMFDRGGDASELDTVLELVSDAWNYFPHKVLGSMSPQEKILEYATSNNRLRSMSEVTILKECFDKILKGGKEESRQAARKVRKLTYSSSASGKEKYENIAAIVRTAPEIYDEILEHWRQENFVMAVSIIYFLHGKEDKPDFYFPWLFQLLQDKNGIIRYAAVKMIYHEIWPLTVHIRHPCHTAVFGERLKPEQADVILRTLFVSLQHLTTTMWEPKYKRYKYVDSLPASPYKSVQMVFAELEDSCGKEYLDRLFHSTNNF